ncbi:MAG: hypothetical protein HZB41_02390 [Ignavibacteriae bacterium]|nr:hypothetical protein [Ignavibacteriota bacterium]
MKKTRDGKVIVVGGVTQNSIVMNFLKNKTNGKLLIPEEAPYFEALGAAIYGLKNGTEPLKSFDNIFKNNASSFVFHKPLSKFIDRVTFKSFERDTVANGDICILGLDVGSTTTKAVIIRENDNKILASVYLYTHGDPIGASRDCYREILNQLNCEIKIIGLGTTGSGRHIAGLHALTESVINEIVAHATAAVYFDPEVDTIFEIGGQDAKYTYIINKVPADYAMNEACSAGTGSFLEESAWESLGVKVKDIEPIAMSADNPPNFSDQCSAFISSDIKTALQENISKEDIVAGLVYSVCLNYVNRVKGNRPVGKKVFMQGGVCYNKAIPIAMAALSDKEIVVPPDPGLMGAFGVALEVKEKIKLGFIQEKEFSLKELVDREVKYKKPFICPGGREKCDLKCQVNIIEIESKNYPFGGACNKYYNVLHKQNVDANSFDYVKKREELLFNKYAPNAELPENAKSIGINLSFHTHTIFPLFYNFFTKLGFNVILPDIIEDEGLERELSSFCYPAQLSLGLFQDLVNKKPDYFFVPEIFEMYVEDADYHRLDFNCTCVFVSGEPFYIKQGFKDCNLGDKLITPFLNFANGFDKEIESFVNVAKQIGIEDEDKAREAYKYALKMQNNYFNDMFKMGDEFLQFLQQNPEEMAVVLKVERKY